MLNDNQNSATDEVATTMLGSKLRALKPKKRVCNGESFAAHYDDIVDAIDRGVSIKSIRDTLAEAGLTLSPATFKRMLAAEAERREQAKTISINAASLEQENAK